MVYANFWCRFTDWYIHIYLVVYGQEKIAQFREFVSQFLCHLTYLKLPKYC